MTLYLSGPMSGIAMFNKPAFDEAAGWLAAQGHVVLNPHEISDVGGHTWVEALRTDLIRMLQKDCQALVMLEGWEDSQGAILEHHVAVALGYQIYELGKNSGGDMEVHLR